MFALTFAAETADAVHDHAGFFLENAWLIPAIPLASFLIILGFGKRLPKGGSGDKTQAASGESDLTELRPVDKMSGGQGDAKQEGGGAVAKEPAERAESTTLANGHSNGHAYGYSAKMLERAGAMLEDDGGSRSDQFAGFQADAPSCDNCGAITVRNGNCYLCHNCGNSMGCS